MRGSTQQRTQDRPLSPPILPSGGTETPSLAVDNDARRFQIDGHDNERWGAAGFEAGWRDADALGSPGDFLEDVEGQLLMLPPHPEFRASSPMWLDTSPAVHSSTSWDSGISFGVGREIQSPTPVGHNAGIFPKREKEGVRQHRTPSPRGEQDAFVHNRSTSYGYPFYPIIEDDNGQINPQFLQRIGLCYDNVSSWGPPPAMSQQRARTPAHQGPIFDADESKFRPQSVPPQNLHRKGLGHSSPPSKERFPSSKPPISPDGRNVHPHTDVFPSQPPTDGWHISTSLHLSSQQVGPPGPQRRKEKFVAERPENKVKGRGEWKDDEPEHQEKLLQKFVSSYKRPTKQFPTKSVNYCEVGWAFAKMRTSNHGRAKYVWCLVTVHEPKKNQVLVLSGTFAGQLRTVREYDLKNYSQETIQALLASGEVVDDKPALTPDEISKKRSLTAQILVDKFIT